MILLVFFFCFLASLLIFEKKTAIGNVVLKSVLAFYLAISGLSLFFVLFLFAGIGFAIFQIIFLLLPLAYIAFSVKSDPALFGFKTLKNAPTLLLLAALPALLQFTHHFFTTVIRWGDWDAWAIWSQHGRFLTDASHYANLFTNDISWTHPDYPLMLPSILAMFWKSFGTETAEVPALFAYVVALSLVLLILSSFLEKKLAVSGMTVFLLLTCSMLLFPFVSTQQADTLIAVFILVPVVLTDHIPDKNARFHLILTGFFATVCGWIKNEGLMFFAIFSFCFLVKYFRKPGYVKFFLVGTAFPLIVLIFFKTAWAPPGDLVSRNGDFLEKLSDWGRYEKILFFGKDYFSENGTFLMYVLGAALVVNYQYYFSLGFLAAAGLFSAYILVYVITPHDIGWHLSTSFHRLVHQVFPLLVYSAFFYMASRPVSGLAKVFGERILKRKMPSATNQHPV